MFLLTVVEGMLLASSAWKSGMLLNILQCTNNYLAQQVSSAQLGKP